MSIQHELSRSAASEIDSRVKALWKSRIESMEIESAGIMDCEQIISEFLEQNEFGCAFEHLTYVISETETNLTTEQANRIRQLNKKLNS